MKKKESWEYEGSQREKKREKVLEDEISILVQGKVVNLSGFGSAKAGDRGVLSLFLSPFSLSVCLFVNLCLD